MDRGGGGSGLTVLDTGLDVLETRCAVRAGSRDRILKAMIFAGSVGWTWENASDGRKFGYGNLSDDLVYIWTVSDE